MHRKILVVVEPRYEPGVQKMIWGEHPCSEKLCRDGKIEDNVCPLCGKTDTKAHFLQCAEVKKEKKWKRILGNARARMRDRGTNPFVALWFEEGLKGREPKQEEIKPLRLNQCVREAFGNQHTIGWENMMSGRMAKGLENLQVLWEDKACRFKGKRRKDPKETIAQTMACGLTGMYAVWKLRCRMVEEVPLSSQQRTLVSEI